MSFQKGNQFGKYKKTWNKGLHIYIGGKKFKKGHIVTKEMRKKIGLAHKGKSVSIETRKKISEAHKGIKLSEKHKQSLKGRSGEKSPTWNGGKDKLKCIICGNEFYDYKSNHKSDKVHCSKKCVAITKSNNSRGEKSHYWQGGIYLDPYPREWRNTLKESIRERDKYTCQICGINKVSYSLSVHHIDYNKENLCPDNLISLCKKCHVKTNSNRDMWIKFFRKDLDATKM